MNVINKYKHTLIRFYLLTYKNKIDLSKFYKDMNIKQIITGMFH